MQEGVGRNVSETTQRCDGHSGHDEVTHNNQRRKGLLMLSPRPRSRSACVRTRCVPMPKSCGADAKLTKLQDRFATEAPRQTQPGRLIHGPVQNSTFTPHLDAKVLDPKRQTAWCLKRRTAAANYLRLKEGQVLPQTVPGTVDERKEGVRCHRCLHETAGVVPHGLWPDIRPFMYPLKMQAGAGGVQGIGGKYPHCSKKNKIMFLNPFDSGIASNGESFSDCIFYSCFRRKK